MAGSGDTQGLLLRHLGGDGSALDDLLETLRPRLVAWATGQLSPELRKAYDREDVAQEILLAVHRGIEGFRGGDLRAFYSWVYSIGRNTIRDLADRQGALKRRLPEPKSFSQTSPSQPASRRERAQRGLTALERLDDDARAVIVLRVIEDRPIAELSELWRCSPNAARIRCFRALEQLRVLLDGLDLASGSGGSEAPAGGKAQSG